MITGGIDISVGSITALVCMVMANQMENHGMSAYAAIAVALVIGLAFGIVQGFLISYLEIQPFIVSLAGLFFGRGMTSMVSTEMISIKNETFLAWANAKIYLPFIGSYSKSGKFHPAYIYPTVIIALIIVAIIAVVMKYTKFGREVYAVGGNAQSALMMGLNVKRIKFKAYVLEGLLAGCGGFLFCLNSCAGFVEQAKGLRCSDQRYHHKLDHHTGYIVQLVGTYRTFRTALLLHRITGNFYPHEEEKRLTLT